MDSKKSTKISCCLPKVSACCQMALQDAAMLGTTASWKGSRRAIHQAGSVSKSSQGEIQTSNKIKHRGLMVPNSIIASVCSSEAMISYPYHIILYVHIYIYTYIYIYMYRPSNTYARQRDITCESNRTTRIAQWLSQPSQQTSPGWW